MSLQVYQVMHLLSGFLLVAVTFQAFAAPDPARRKRSLMIGGILSLLMLTGGFGAMARVGYDFASSPWIHIKILCWLVLSAMAGIAFRRPKLAPVLTIVTTVAIAAALYAVYFMRVQG